MTRSLCDEQDINTQTDDSLLLQLVSVSLGLRQPHSVILAVHPHSRGDALKQLVTAPSVKSLQLMYLRTRVFIGKEDVFGLLRRSLRGSARDLIA